MTTTLDYSAWLDVLGTSNLEAAVPTMGVDIRIHAASSSAEISFREVPWWAVSTVERE